MICVPHSTMRKQGALNRDARRRFRGHVGCDRTPIKVSNRGNFELALVMVCRSSNRLAFLRFESGQCCDLSATTARNIAITRVKASPTRHLGGTPGSPLANDPPRKPGIVREEHICPMWGTVS
jgi:hypothetical protein